VDSILEYTHRVLAGLASLSIVAAAAVGLRKARAIRWVSRPPAIAIVFLIAVIIFGAMVVLRGLEPGLAALDLGSALIVLALVLTTTVVAERRQEEPTLPDRLSFESGLALPALGTLVAVFVVLVSGVLVAEEGSVVRCLGWPLDGGLDLAGVRSLLGGGAGLLVIIVVVRAWRLPARPKAIRATATAMGITFAIEIGIGALIVMLGFSIWLHVLYAATATALWALLVVLTVRAALPSPGPAS
jgi:cytochrome c oxidase assembly protein subunit 15